MGIRPGLVACGRRVTPPMTNPVGNVDGWYRPWHSSPELVFYVQGAPLGEIYPISQYELDGEWQARIMPHVGKAYDTQDEAMLFLEAVAALGL